jgi:signal transduction histidine kinase
MIAARSTAPTAAALAAHDQLLRNGLLRTHFPARIAIRHENPWLGLTGVNALQGNAQLIDAVRLPDGVQMYRGSASLPSDHIIRYTLSHDKTLYEVGYSYQAYRETLQHAAAPLIGLLIATTGGILTVFPRFFRFGLVAPLTRLLNGVGRVNNGDLSVRVPITVADEIGRLTVAFNRMVASLSGSEERLRALNLTLEERVSDRTRDLKTLYDIAALVSQAPPLPELLTTALAKIVPGLDGATGAIFVGTTQESDLHLQATYALPAERIAAVTSARVWQRVYESEETLLIHDMLTDPRTLELFPTPVPYATFIGVRIRGQDGTLGVLGLFGTAPMLFNVEDLGLLEAVSEQLGVAIQNARLRERAEVAIVLEERQRLARDLHDSVTQLLYSQTLFANAASKSLHAGKSAQAADYLQRLSGAAIRALREMRLMIYRLRPTVLAEVGLVGAVRRRLEMVEQRAGVAISFSCDTYPDLDTDLEKSLYHIIEEALNNTLKHADATEVDVELGHKDGDLTISIRDNGRGFNIENVSPGLGLQSLCERAEGLGGTLAVESSPGQGTLIVVRVPFTSPPVC